MTGANAPLSILVVIHDFALGGTERIAVRLANRWAAAGAAVTIFCGAPDGPLRALVDETVTVATAIPPVPRASRTRGRLARAARAYLDRHPHAVAFVPGNYHWIVAAALAGHTPVVAQVSAALEKPQRGRLRQWLFERRMRRQLRGAAAVVTLSEEHRAQAARILGDARAVVIPLPALPDDAPAPVAVPDGPPLILGVGRLVPEKGFATLLQAFVQLSDGHARLAIVGEGPDRARLEALAASLGIADRVELPGYVTDSRPWFDHARLFVLSSQHEGYCAVLVEALAAGRPSIATDCTPATKLLRSMAEGAVVPIDDPAAMRAAIAEQLAVPPPDPAALAAGVAHHRIGPVADAYLALFAEVA